MLPVSNQAAAAHPLYMLALRSPFFTFWLLGARRFDNRQQLGGFISAGRYSDVLFPGLTKNNVLM